MEEGSERREGEERWERGKGQREAKEGGREAAVEGGREGEREEKVAYEADPTSSQSSVSLTSPCIIS